MNELEMAMTLGILPEPVQNRVHMDPFIEAEITYLAQVFQVVDGQKKAIGSFSTDAWCELLPWHSMN